MKNPKSDKEIKHTRPVFIHKYNGSIVIDRGSKHRTLHLETEELESFKLTFSHEAEMYYYRNVYYEYIGGL